MARPTTEQARMHRIAEQTDTAVEAWDVALCWLEAEAQRASEGLDNPRRARLVPLSNAVARVMQALYNIKNETIQ